MLLALRSLWEAKFTVQVLDPATLASTGPPNLTLVVGKQSGATLAFTGIPNLGKDIIKGVISVLSFTGLTNKGITKTTLTAIQSFTGNVTKLTSKPLSGVLPFAGGFTLLTTFRKLLVAASISFTGTFRKTTSKSLITGILSFTGPARVIGPILKGLTATLTFVGPTNLRNVITKTVTTGSLSFVGAIAKRTIRSFPGVLTFTGAIAKIKGGIFTQALSGTLSFSGGSLVKQTQKVFTAMLSPASNLLKSTARIFQATLNTIGVLLFPGTFGVAKVGIQHNTIPISIDIAVTETLPFKVDVSNYLQTGDTVGAIHSSLISVPTGTPVDTVWRNTITVVGSVITIPILGSALRLGQTYQMTIVFVASPVKYATFITYINVVG